MAQLHTKKLSSCEAVLTGTEPLFGKNLELWRNLIFNLGKIHTSNPIPTPSFSSHPGSPEPLLQCPRPMPPSMAQSLCVSACVSQALAQHRSPWCLPSPLLLSVFWSLCVCVVMQAHRYLLAHLEPEHPFGPCAGKGALMWQEGQSAVVPSCLPPASSFLLTEEQLEMGGTRTSKCPEQVHRRKRLCVRAPPAGITNWGWSLGPCGTLRSQTAHKEMVAGGAGPPGILLLPPLGPPGAAC